MNDFKVKTFRDMKVWQDAHMLTIEVYGATKEFPDKEQYGLTSQIRRSAASIGANIAEGFGRYHFKDKIKFYLNARGSSTETQSHLLLAKDLGYLENKQAENFFDKAEDISKQLNILIKITNKNL